MEALRVNPDTLMKPLAAYHQVVRKGSTVAVAGMVGMDVEGNIVGEGDIIAQTRKSLESMKACLEAVGATMNDVIKTTIYLTDLANYKGMNIAYNEFLEDVAPARATVLVDLALPELLVEIDALAIVGDD
jgi:2-iminobutanoate/2-iminopropanoate deaminase